MNVYELRSGMLVCHVAAQDEDHAREQGEDAERFPDLHFLPFTVKQIIVDGYTIVATPDATEAVAAPRRGRKKDGVAE